MADTNERTPLLKVEHLSKEFPAESGMFAKRFSKRVVSAVNDISFEIYPGETFGLVGESGCGKSTTANVMCGLQAPTSGKVYFKGKDVTKRTAEDRRHMGRVISVVFQNPATALNPRMVVREQLLDPMRVHNLGTEAEQEKRVKELLELTGLPLSLIHI